MTQINLRYKLCSGIMEIQRRSLRPHTKIIYNVRFIKTIIGATKTKRLHNIMFCTLHCPNAMQKKLQYLLYL